MSIDDVCWLYPTPNIRGYGPHRLVYEVLVGPIPKGLDLDHTCHNADLECRGGDTCPHRACYNPKHLAPKTRSANLRAGRTYAPEVIARRVVTQTVMYDEPGVREAFSEQGLLDAQRRWAQEDRSPLFCDCGRGPYKGPFGVKIHALQTHGMLL